MRRIRYQVACSLDGYIAGPDDACDWIVPDPDIDLAASPAVRRSLSLRGRRVYEESGIVLLPYDVGSPDAGRNRLGNVLP